MSTTPLSQDFIVRPATMDDLGDVLAVFSAYSMKQVGKILLEETELQAEWKMPTFSLQTNTCVVVAPDGRLVGYAEWTTWMDEDPSFDESLYFVAMDGDEIAGFSLCYDVTGEGPNVGAVEQLGIRRPWRQRGLGLALLQHSFGELYQRGRTTVTLGVDAQSLTGALRLYEKAGMHVRHRADRFEKELRPGKDLSTQSLEN